MQREGRKLPEEEKQLKRDIYEKKENKKLEEEEKMKCEREKLAQEGEIFKCNKKQIKKLKEDSSDEEESDDEDNEVEENIKKSKYIEFPYIDEINKNILLNHKGNIVFNDDGKKSLLMMKDKSNVFLNYTSKQYLKYTNRLKYQERINKAKKKIRIHKKEIKYDELKNLSTKKLIEICLEKGMKKTGDKEMLIQRILTCNKDNEEIKYDEFKNLSKKKLSEICVKKGIQERGNEEILLKRILIYKEKNIKTEGVSIIIEQKENELTDYISRTINKSKFIEYCNKKLEINNILLEEYECKEFRQYKWYGYIDRQRQGDRLLNTIEKTFGKETIIISGDASVNPTMRNFVPTPNKRLKLKIKERFKIYSIDEFRTSCINHYTKKYQIGNLKYKDKENKTRKLHSVLTYKMENQRLGCINRDKNAVYNMEDIYNHYLRYLQGNEENPRPIEFCRGNII
jgi:hypothetical protein